VLFIKGVDGESLSTRLSSQGFKSYSSAACAWNDHQVNLWLPRLGIDAEKVQSSVFIPLSTLKLSGIKEALVKLVGELRKISGFS
jgi:cysteine sulfinate desulfinase/cysteine desulfurase-like protein